MASTMVKSFTAQSTDAARLFEVLIKPQIAEVVLEEIIQATEKDFFENYITEEDEEEEK